MTGRSRKPDRRTREEATTRSTSVTERIRQALLDGQLEAGARINEVHLSRLLSVSRTPIRAALQTLAGEGLLDHVPNRGYTVRAFTLTEIVDAYEMRALAEGLSARLAAERGMVDVLRARVEQALALGDQALTENRAAAEQREGYGRANAVFHAAIEQAAGSRLISDVIRICDRIPQAVARNIVAFDLENVRRRHSDHRRIYEAIICREPQSAEALMREHVASVKTSMIRAFTRQNWKGAAETNDLNQAHPHQSNAIL